MWRRNLDIWRFDFGQWSYMAGHVVDLSSLHQVWRSYGCPFLSYEFWHLP